MNKLDIDIAELWHRIRYIQAAVQKFDLLFQPLLRSAQAIEGVPRLLHTLTRLLEGGSRFANCSVYGIQITL